MTSSFDARAGTPEPRRVDASHAHAAMQSGAAMMLDVRDARLFDNAHIESAIALPLAELDAWDGRLPPRLNVPASTLLILYCA